MGRYRGRLDPLFDALSTPTAVPNLDTVVLSGLVFSLEAATAFFGAHPGIVRASLNLTKLSASLGGLTAAGVPPFIAVADDWLDDDDGGGFLGLAAEHAEAVPDEHWSLTPARFAPWTTDTAVLVSASHLIGPLTTLSSILVHPGALPRPALTTLEVHLPPSTSPAARLKALDTLALLLRSAAPSLRKLKVTGDLAPDQTAVDILARAAPRLQALDLPDPFGFAHHVPIAPLGRDQLARFPDLRVRPPSHPPHRNFCKTTRLTSASPPSDPRRPAPHPHPLGLLRPLLRPLRPVRSSPRRPSFPPASAGRRRTRRARDRRLAGRLARLFG